MMPQAYRLEVSGTEQVIAALRKLGRNASDLSAVFGLIGSAAAAEARARAPKQSGRLAGTIRPARFKTATSVTATSVYAGVHEYGWAARNISAQPYLRPAADSKADSSAEQIASEIQRHINAAGLG